ncbi:MAG: xylulokinase [Eubacteriales bacterium]|nr:xylulokinase [Eubacteriales bacterium]
MSRYLLAHDIGTSGNKASLFSVEGELVKSTVAPYETNYQSGGIAEQEPRDWWNAVCCSTREIMSGIAPEDVAAVSFSGQMQCCLVVDKQGQVLRPAMIWADQRAEPQAKKLREAFDERYAYELLGHRLSPSYSIEKLMWIKDNEPEIFRNTYKMLQVKDYIIYRMTGKFVTDYSDASGTNALDLENLCWSQEILDAAQIDIDKLPELHNSTDVIGTLTEEAAAALGLTTMTKVVCGGGDGPCSALGAGCIEKDQMFLTFGTSAWIGGTTDKKFLDEDQVFFCFAHVIPGRYMPCGTMQSAGSAYSYARNTFCQEEIRKAQEEGKSSWELINEMVENSPAGAKGLLFLPYLTGERAPRWNPDASGSFQGIRMYHQREDYIRAVVEGVAMNLELILNAYRKYLDIDSMILTGGGAKGDIVAQILSDVMSAELVRPDHVEEATSIAAAVIAGVGCGIYEDFTAIKSFLKFGNPVVPDKSNEEVYSKAKKLFDDVYEALKPLYARF